MALQGSDLGVLNKLPLPCGQTDPEIRSPGTIWVDTQTFLANSTACLICRARQSGIMKPINQYCTVDERFRGSVKIELVHGVVTILGQSLSQPTESNLTPVMASTV